MVRTNVSPNGERLRLASRTMPNSVLSTGDTTGSTAIAPVFRSGSSTLSGSIATASDSCAMFRIIVTDSQAMEGTVLGPKRDGPSPAIVSLTNSRRNPAGNRDVLTNG